MTLDGGSDLVVRRAVKGEIDMTDCKLVTWHGLSVDEITKIFPDAICLGGTTVEFDSVDMAIWRFSDAAGNSAFAFDKGNGLASHGSQILARKTVDHLRAMGVQIH